MLVPFPMAPPPPKLYQSAMIVPSGDATERTSSVCPSHEHAVPLIKNAASANTVDQATRVWPHWLEVLRLAEPIGMSRFYSHWIGQTLRLTGLQSPAAARDSKPRVGQIAKCLVKLVCM
jgi:hypothetical protein